MFLNGTGLKLNERELKIKGGHHSFQCFLIFDERFFFMGMDIGNLKHLFF